jgi:hypothetical protein
MEPRHLYTIKWTQPYSTEKERPYLRSLHEAVEHAIEAQVARNECPQAKEIIERIRNASKS